MALPVEIGTTLPTCSVAVWLLMTTSDGLDNTLTLVTVMQGVEDGARLCFRADQEIEAGKGAVDECIGHRSGATAAAPVAVVGGSRGRSVCVACVLRIEP